VTGSVFSTYAASRAPAHPTEHPTTPRSTPATARNRSSTGRTPRAASQHTFDPRLGYRGELHLDTQIHLRAHNYQPLHGRFTSIDPLEGVAGTPTISYPYHYTDNNPLNAADPSGLQPSDVDLGLLQQSGGGGGGVAMVGLAGPPPTPILIGGGTALAGGVGIASGTTITLGTATGIGLVGVAIGCLIACDEWWDLPDLPDLPGPLPNLPNLPKVPSVGCS
jgi:RHS repeat-associated protein